MVRSVLFIALLGACHKDCGDNYASTYAETLNPKASCYNILTSNEQSDFAECKVGEENWYCYGDSVKASKCWIVGPQVRIRVETTPLPAEKVP